MSIENLRRDAEKILDSRSRGLSAIGLDEAWIRDNLENDAVLQRQCGGLLDDLEKEGIPPNDERLRRGNLPRIIRIGAENNILQYLGWAKRDCNEQDVSKWVERVKYLASRWEINLSTVGAVGVTEDDLTNLTKRGYLAEARKALQSLQDWFSPKSPQSDVDKIGEFTTLAGIPMEFIGTSEEWLQKLTELKNKKK